MKSHSFALIFLIALLLPFSTRASYLGNASDTLLPLPRLLLGWEEGKIRYGLQFSVMKTLLHRKRGLTPYLEGGITLFDKIDHSPDNKKHLALKIGCLWEIGPLAVSFESGILHGNERFSATSGLGVWKIIPFVSDNSKKTLQDFPSYAAYVKWRNAYLKEANKIFKGCSVSARIFYNYSIQPSLSGGIFFDLFL